MFFGRTTTLDGEFQSILALLPTTILVFVLVECTEIDRLVVDEHTRVVLVRSVPVVDLVEIKLQHDFLGGLGNTGVGFERFFVSLSVPSEKLGEGRRFVDVSVGPSGGGSILEVLLSNDLIGRASCQSSGGIVEVAIVKMSRRVHRQVDREISTEG